VDDPAVVRIPDAMNDDALQGRCCAEYRGFSHNGVNISPPGMLSRLLNKANLGRTSEDAVVIIDIKNAAPSQRRCMFKVRLGRAIHRVALLFFAPHHLVLNTSIPLLP
jgi:hypothetical protein